MSGRSKKPAEPVEGPSARIRTEYPRPVTEAELEPGHISEEPPIEAEVTAIVPIDVAPVLAKDHPTMRVVVEKLTQPTPKGARKTRAGPGGVKLTYAPWAYAAGVLNDVFGPTWGMEFIGEPKRLELPDLPAKHTAKCAAAAARPSAKPCVEHLPRKREEVMVTVRLRTPWGCQEATASHTFWPSNDDSLYGDVVQAAQSMALRRAAARWGIALDLYANVSDDAETSDPGIADARAAWKSALGQHGLTEMLAIPKLSEKLAGDATLLPTITDCLTATGEAGAKAYWALIALLDEKGK